MCYNQDMKTIAIFGHRQFNNKNLKQRLKSEIEKHICDGVQILVGTHGDFDAMAISVCRELIKQHPNVKITAVLTTLTPLQKGSKELYSAIDLYRDIETMTYEIEEVYFKKQIVVSNQHMVDDSDLIICYVDMNKRKSGAKKAVRYAMKQGKDIVNLFKETDNIFYGMTEEEKEIEWKRFIQKQ